jgi:hypothetical protein
MRKNYLLRVKEENRMSMIEISYDVLFEFLDDYFNLEAFEEDEEAENALDLINIAMEELFDEEYDFEYIQVLINQIHSFLQVPIHESGKALYIRQHVGVEMLGLPPLEFLEFIQFRLKAEVWKKK